MSFFKGITSIETLRDNIEPLCDNTELAVDGIEPLCDNTELAVDGIEPLCDDTELAVDGIEPLCDDTELVVDGIEPLCDDTELVVDGIEPLCGDTESENTTKDNAQNTDSIDVSPTTRDELLVEIDELSAELDELSAELDSNIQNDSIESKEMFDIVFKGIAKKSFIFTIINSNGEHNGHIIITPHGKTKIIESAFAPLSQNAQVCIKKKATEFFNAIY